MPDASTSPPRSASAARSQASEGAGNGRPRTSLALSFSADAARAAPSRCVAACAVSGGEHSAAARCQSRSRSATTEITGTAGTHAPSSSTAASITLVCVAIKTFGTRRAAESVGERGHRHGGMREPTPGDRGRPLTPSSVSGLDQAGGDDRGAVAALLHERGDLVVLVPEVGGHLGDFVDAPVAGDSHRRHAERVGEERRPRIGGKWTRCKREVSEDARHGALRLPTAQPDCAREHARREHRFGRDPQVLEGRVLEGSRARPSAVTRRQRREGLHERDPSSVGPSEPRREDEEERGSRRHTAAGAIPAVWCGPPSRSPLRCAAG